MIEKSVKVVHLKAHDSVVENLMFWLKKPVEERISAVEYLRRQFHGSTARLQRVATVVQRS
jgi:hypothetical protein